MTQVATIPVMSFDLETGPVVRPDLVERVASGVKAPANYKDPQKISEYKEEAKVKAILDTALNPTFGRIVSIAVYDGAKPSAVNENEMSEREMIEWALKKFSQFFATSIDGVIVGHNIVGFDLPFLYRRGVIVGADGDLLSLLPPPSYPAWKVGNAGFYDTMLAWGRPYPKLKDLAASMGILDGSEDDMGGGDAVTELISGNMASVVEHNINDTIINYKVARRMLEAGMAM